MRLQELFEDQNYNAMFNPVASVLDQSKLAKHKYETLKSIWRTRVAFAKSSLKRKDRVHWFLRCVRIGLLVMVHTKYGAGAPYDEEFQWPEGYDETTARRARSDAGVAQANKLRARLLKDYERQFGLTFDANESGLSDFERDCLSLARGSNLQKWAHYVSMEDQIPEIKAVKWLAQQPRNLNTDLHRIETNWKNANPDAGSLISQGNDKTFMRFPDGWQWMLLDRTSCSEEGRAMGHCGNSAAARYGDQILSLRKPIKQPNGKVGWKPYATFILNDGALGEMKGRFNHKPARELHPYIVALLKNPAIRIIRGGGYASDSNFEWHDLTVKKQDEIEKANPHLVVAEENDQGCMDNHDWEGQNNGDLECSQCGAVMDASEDECFGNGDAHVFDITGKCEDCGYAR